MMSPNLAVVAGEETKGVEPQKVPTPVEVKTDPDKLNAAEKLELETHEAVIAKGNKSFFELGDALNAIRNSKLYRESYRTFEDYVEKKWLMSRPNAYRRMFAAEMMGVLTAEGGTLPRNESQLRPFSVLKVERDDWKTMWSYIVKQAKSKPLTAVLITELILKKQGKLPTKSKKKGKNFAASKPLKNKLKGLLALVAEARKKFDTGKSVKSLLARIEAKLKALKLA